MKMYRRRNYAFVIRRKVSRKKKKAPSVPRQEKWVTCLACRTPDMSLTRHHVYTKAESKRTVLLCCPCHTLVHKRFTNLDLALGLLVRAIEFEEMRYGEPPLRRAA